MTSPGNSVAQHPVVLFVDDEERILASLRRMILDEPYEVLTATSGGQALDIMEDRNVDIIVSDERMPGMRGSELLAEVRRLYPETCRVMLTGHADLNAALQSINQGRIFRFLTKPVTSEELVKVLHEGVQERSQTTRLLELSQRAGNVCSFEVIQDPESKISTLRWSENARYLLQFDDESRLDSLAPLYERLHPDDLSIVRSLNTACLEDFHCPSTEFRIILDDGQTRWLSQASDTARADDSGSTRILSVLKDITEQKRQQETLEYQAFHDVLTGLSNRSSLLKHLELALQDAERNGRLVALLFIDLDDFKTVNDSMGHPFGDWLLQAFSKRVSSLTPADTLVSRMGGDEFAILAPAVSSPEEARTIADKVLGMLAQPFTQSEYEVFTSAAVGITFSDSPQTLALDMLREADTAMYEAKAMGKNSVRIFDSSMHDKASTRFQVIGDLHRALQREELFLVYQPIVRLDTLAVAGFEALVRWNHPERGVVMPDSFIAIAEESGLIAELGMQVLQKALHQFAQWPSQPGAALPFMSVNLSVRQLHQSNLVRLVRTSLDDAGIDASLLKLEVTESGIMDDVELSLRMLGDLKQLGLKLQIDDFGTGYSSLAYLQRIPADNLKVDKSFVGGMEHSEDKLAIVRTILGLAESLGMSVVAEGIETPQQLAMLRELGCEYGQGYLFDKPLHPDKVDTSRIYTEVLG